MRHDERHVWSILLQYGIVAYGAGIATPILSAHIALAFVFQFALLVIFASVCIGTTLTAYVSWRVYTVWRAEHQRKWKFAQKLIWDRTLLGLTDGALFQFAIVFSAFGWGGLRLINAELSTTMLAVSATPVLLMWIGTFRKERAE